MHCDAMQFDVAGLLNVLNVFVCVCVVLVGEMHICTCSGSMSSHCFTPLCQGKHASVDTVSHQSESNYGISCKSVQSPRRPIEPIAIQHSLHPSSLLPGHHSKIPSCMKRFARNAFQWSSIIIHNGHLPLEPPIRGTFPICSSHNPHHYHQPRWELHGTRPSGLADPETVERCRDSYNLELDRQLQDATRSHGTKPWDRWPMGLRIDDG